MNKSGLTGGQQLLGRIKYCDGKHSVGLAVGQATAVPSAPEF